MAASFAALRVRIADGSPQRIHDKGAQHMPGEEAWLVGERRASGERKYYLSNLTADATAQDARHHDQGALGLRTGASATQGRTRPDHFEGRSWPRPPSSRVDDHDRIRLHRSRLAAEASVGKKNPPVGRHNRRCPRSDAPSSLPARAPPYRCPHSQANAPSIARINLPK